MLTSASSPKYHPQHNQPHSTSTPQRYSPRPKANTHSPRLRSKRASLTAETTISSTSQSEVPALASQSEIPLQHQHPPKPETAERGTQYTPPDWPPTSSRSSLRQIPQDILAPTTSSSHSQATSTSTNLAPSAVSHPVPAQSGVQVVPGSYVSTSEIAASFPVAEAATRAAGSGSGSAVAGQDSETGRAQAQIEAQASETATPSARRSHAAMSASSTRTNSPATSQRLRVKRTKSVPGAVPKVMPRNYAECDPKILATLIADLLMELIKYNDELPLGNNQLTRFHSRAPPGISVTDYLLRLTHHATLIPPILLSMVFYIDRLCALYPTFTMNSLTVHRFLITAATVASKGLSDSFWTNNTYARVGGVTVKELALLELEFLHRVQWRIVPKAEALVDYYKSLVGRSGEYVIEGAEDEESDEGERSSDSDSDMDDDDDDNDDDDEILEDEDEIMEGEGEGRG